jgi:DNA end-binding protein Ku
MTAKTLQAVPEPSAAPAPSSRCLWKGSLSFGLVHMPVKLHSATGEQSAPLHQVHRACGGRIAMKKTCPACAAELATADVGKGYEMADGTMIALTDDEAAAGLADSREIEVTSFCPSAQVDPALLGKPYYLAPDVAGGKGYALLAATLAKTGKSALVRLTLRKAESMAVVRAAGPYNDMLVLQLLAWADEVRMAPALPAIDPPKPAELRMAAQLVASMTADFSLAAYHSASRTALNEVIEAKIAAAAPAGKAKPEVTSLAATLRASLAQSKAEREAASA